jgi:hypothetical protein
MSYDSAALFSTARGNLPTTEVDMSLAAINAGRAAMRARTAPGASAVRATLKQPKILIGGALNEEIMFELTTSNVKVNTSENATLPNFVRQSGITDYVVATDVIEDSGSGSADWAMCSDPKRNNTLIIGFVQGREEPEIITQDSPTEGTVFTNDRIQIKIRHEYGGSVGRDENWYAGRIT